MHEQYQTAINGIIAWAQDNPDIQGIIIIGSQARSEPPADQWSDLDLMVFANDQQALMQDNTWFERFGSVVCFFDEIVSLHFTNWRWCVKRVLYADHREVDFSILPYAQMDEVLAVNKDILSKGWRVIYDTHPGELDAKLGALIQAHPEIPTTIPTEAELRPVVSELLYHVIWAFKKIKRKELWVAVCCINCHMKNLLLRLIEAHNASIGKAPDFLHYNGRFLEQRTSPRILSGLTGCFTRYDEADAIRTLEHLFDLTYTLSSEIYAANGYPFDAAQFGKIKEIYCVLKEVDRAVNE